MKREGVNFIFVLAFAVFLSSVVGAASIEVEEISSTLKTVSIEGASELYAYEINFSIDSGSISSVTSANFLGPTSEATYGYNEKNSYLYVYGSRLDSSQTGVDGDGDLFNTTITGGITLKGATLIAGNGSTQTIVYNDNGDIESDTTTEGTATTSTGGSSTGNEVDTDQVQENRNLIIVPSEFSINAVLGESEEEEFTILNNGQEKLQLSLTTSGFKQGVISLGETSIALEPGERENVKFKILVEDPDFNVGRIIIRQGSVAIQEVPIIVNVKSDNFLFDAKLDIPFQFKDLAIGDNLLVDIGLLQVGSPLQVDVVANYIIKDFEGNIILEESETFAVQTEKSYQKEFLTAGLEPGKYVLGLEIVYPGAFAVSSSQFQVLGKEQTSLDLRIIIIGAIAIILVVGVLTVIWALKGRKKVRHTRRKRK